MRSLFIIAAIAAMPAVGLGDSVDLQNGNSWSALCFRKARRTSQSCAGRASSGSRDPASHRSTAKAAGPVHKPKDERATAPRLPDYKAITITVAAQPWASNFRQIPATVIDVGVLRSVPYKSHRAGSGYEINVYGDPESPAGFEIGVNGALVRRRRSKGQLHRVRAETARRNRRPGNRACSVAGKRCKSPGACHLRNNAADGPGRVWRLVGLRVPREEARRRAASDDELKSISAPRSSIRSQKGTSDEVGDYRDDDGTGGWRPNDLHDARRPAASSKSGHSDGSVYVRGYYRKDGTYVQPHSRSALRR